MGAIHNDCFLLGVGMKEMLTTQQVVPHPLLSLELDIGGRRYWLGEVVAQTGSVLVVHMYGSAMMDTKM
eukprot:scaffold380_cov92-Cylindrotheca_fusiformis.AAC.2